MTAAARPLHKRLTLIDLVFLLAAVAGGGVYFFVLPTQHPDATADYSLDEEGAIEAAQTFLQRSGRSDSGLTAEAEFFRFEDLLDSLQTRLGRKEALRVLTEEPDAFPAYHWRVDWHTDDDDNDRVYRVLLTQTGKMWSFSNSNEMTERVRPHRTALAEIYGPNERERTSTTLQGLPDSILTGSLQFAPLREGSSVGASGAAAASIRPTHTLFDLAPDTMRLSVQLDSAATSRLALYHLSRFPLAVAGVTFQLDSLNVPPDDARARRAYFSAKQPFHAQTVEAYLDVLPTGALQHTALSYNPGPRTSQNALTNLLLLIVQGVTYFLLALTFIVYFFRRLLARTIDVKVALLDGLLMGALFALFIGLAKGPIGVDFDDSIWEILVTYLLALSVAGGLFALGIFLISGATDSLARASWPEKLETLTLARHTAWVNQRVGSSLLRGVLLAYALVGTITTMLLFLPDTPIDVERYNFLLDVSYFQAGYNLAFAGWLGYAALALTLLGIGSFLYRRFKSPWVVVPVLTITLILLQPFPLALMPGVLTWIPTAIFAVALALCFWYFDFLTTFTAFVITWLVWMSSAGWLIESSPIQLDFILTHVFSGGALVLGVTGIFSNQTGLEYGKYVPAYMQEMAHKERMKKELEIAHIVQESFLPRRMPHVEGLDLAAMCLAANEVGGDYYDFIVLGPNRLGVVIGDVSGKGIQAAFYMTLTKGILQTLSREESSPAVVMCRLNGLFCENVPRGTFISMIYGIVDLEERTFTFARAGHNPVILKRSPSQEPDLIQPNGLAIGLVSGQAFDQHIEEKKLHLRVGDVLVFYTDGFSEAMNTAKDLYGDDRLAQKVSDVGQRTANEILRAVTEDVHHFVEAAGRHDDMTMVVLKLERRKAYIPEAITAQSARPEA